MAVLAACSLVARPTTAAAARTKCWGALRSSAPNSGATTLDCQDGDPDCDLDRAANGTCAIPVAACLYRDDVPRCTPRPVERVSLRARPGRLARDLAVTLPRPPPLPVTAPTCGDDVVINLPLRQDAIRRQKPSARLTLRMRTHVRGSRRRDSDTLRVRCLPNQGAGRCPPNPDGGPSELRAALGGIGTDVDVGWTGMAHNLRVVASADLRLCLSGCGSITRPLCRDRPAETRAVNRPLFGAPYPAVVSGFPLCILSRFGPEPISNATADLERGSFAGVLSVRSEVHQTNLTQVCPRCSGAAPGSVGVCDSGARQGRACVTATVLQVTEARGDPAHALSPDCPPAGKPLATLPLDLALATGTVALAGPRPCGESQDDACGGGICNAGCTGAACVDRIDGQCLHSRGGIAQVCCATDTTRPCFPTASGAPILRVGNATPPTPAFGNPIYPKFGAATPVGTACLTSSGLPLVDSLVGLPGPAVTVLPMTTVWLP